jgi:plasmid stabilization system protein ParE
VIKPLLFEPEASQELEDAARWYEDQRSGLGQRFLDAVAATVDRLVTRMYFPRLRPAGRR